MRPLPLYNRSASPEGNDWMSDELFVAATDIGRKAWLPSASRQCISRVLRAWVGAPLVMLDYVHCFTKAYNISKQPQRLCCRLEQLYIYEYQLTINSYWNNLMSSIFVHVGL